MICTSHIEVPHVEMMGVEANHIVIPKGIDPVLSFGWSRRKNASGNPLWKNDMPPRGGAALDATGPGGAANPTANPNLPGYSYDGGDSLSCGAVSSFSFIQNTGIFWISLWAMFSADITGDDFWPLLGNFGNSGDKGIMLGYENRIAAGSPAALRLQISKGTLGTFACDFYSTASLITRYKKHHIVVYGDGSNAYLMVDSVPAGSSALAGLSAGDSSNALSIGKNAASTKYHTGSIYEMAIGKQSIKPSISRALYQTNRHIYGR